MLNLMSSSFFSVDMVDMDSTESAHGIRHHVEEVANLMTKANFSDFFPLFRSLDLQGLRRKAFIYRVPDNQLYVCLLPI